MWFLPDLLAVGGAVGVVDLRGQVCCPEVGGEELARVGVVVADQVETAGLEALEGLERGLVAGGGVDRGLRDLNLAVGGLDAGVEILEAALRGSPVLRGVLLDDGPALADGCGERDVEGEASDDDARGEDGDTDGCGDLSCGVDGVPPSVSCLFAVGFGGDGLVVGFLRRRAAPVVQDVGGQEVGYVAAHATSSGRSPRLPW